MRLFIALELPDGCQRDLSALARQLARSCSGRFVAPGTRHVTLAFLGEVDETQTRHAIDALDAAFAGAAPVALRPTGLGKFGRAADATLWLGLDGSTGLSEAAERLREELAIRDVPFDDKPFKPHVTLARRTRIPSGALEPLAFPDVCEARVVTLFKSTLEPTGAVYKPLYSVELT